MDIEALREQDLDEADRIFRLAFGTFIGMPDPMQFAGDSDMIRTRFRAPHVEAFGAYRDGDLLGSNFATRWGSVGFFGPLTVRPDLWDQGVASKLMEPVVAAFDRWGCTHTGLFTFSNSAKHHGLYGKFGFVPRCLTPVMGRPVPASAPAGGWTAAGDTWTITDALYPGLDLSDEIASLRAQAAGEAIVLEDGCALAVCHAGAGSEAGSGNLYVKFGVARDAAAFEQLLDACDALAAELGAANVTIGVNTARVDAYRHAVARGFRSMMPGVQMTKDGAIGYDRADAYVIDDWR
jgi:GNAT superfamily N-acetyltransferase